MCNACLIDLCHFCPSQVESLTAARKSAMQGQEPSDAIRVVNALLTQIDHIKRYTFTSKLYMHVRYLLFWKYLKELYAKKPKTKQNMFVVVLMFQISQCYYSHYLQCHWSY